MIPYSLQMSLELVPSISCLPNPGVESIVDRVELVPHVVGACPQCAVNLTAQTFAGSTFLLRPGNVLLCEPTP